MPDESDMDLVREYARRNSEPAFAELVQRHIALVYSVALRFTRNPPDAQDVAQAVFVIFTRKAAGLRAETILTGWLYETTRLTALQWLRNQARRRHREQEAFMQSELDAQAGTTWDQLAPLLDEAMLRLGQTDRDALVLRFFEGRNLQEVGSALGASKEAAKKRVNRALEKLRHFFVKRGVNSTASAIAESISAHSIQAAPAALAKTVTAVALAKGTTASASTLTLIKGALNIMAWTKAKTAIVAGVAVILAAGTTTVMMHGNGRSSSSLFQLRLISTNADSRSDMMTVANVRSQSGRLEMLNVQRKVLLDRSAIRSAQVVTNSFIGQPPAILVDIRFTPAAARQFARITRENIGRRLAIVVDGKLISAPRIASEIPSGEAQISGNFTTEQAARLASLLNNPSSK